MEESHPGALDEHEQVHHFGVVVNCHTVLALEQIGAMVGKKIGRDDVELWTWTMAERGLSVSAGEYLAAIDWLQVWTRRIAKWWSDEKFDLLLTPTIAEPPPPLGELVTTREDPTAGWERLMEVIQFTPPYNATGQPAISLPLHWNAAGLPIGTHLVAGFGREDLLIQVSSQSQSFTISLIIFHPLDAIAGNMPGDPYSAPPQRRPFVQEIGTNPGRLRIGVMKRSPKGGSPLHPDCVAAVEDVAKLLQSLGHSVQESHPAALDEHEQVHHFGVVVSCHTVLALEQIGAMVGKKIGRDDVELWTWTMAERGLSVSAGEYLAAIDWLQVWTRRIAKWWSDEKFDLLLTPTIAEPPPPLGELVTTREDPTAGWERLMEVIQFTPPYNATGQPAISLPLHWNAAGLPIGAHLVAGFGREDLLIQVSSQLEQARPWKDRRPPICA